MSLLQITDLCKTYTINGTQHHILQKLNLTADCDKITVILGKSGCGKTTLLRLICGLEGYDSGSIELPPHLNVGMMFQEARLMPWLTCKENIGFGQKLPQQELKQLLSTVGLSDFADAYPKQLSGGMQQRTALARTLAQKSQLILMDEPFAALDYFTRLQLQQELLRIKKLTQTGMIFVTHNIDEAMTIADTILVMQKGNIEKKIDLPVAPERDILSEPYLSYKKSILASLLHPDNI